MSDESSHGSLCERARLYNLRKNQADSPIKPVISTDPDPELVEGEGEWRTCGCLFSAPPQAMPSRTIQARACNRARLPGSTRTHRTRRTSEYCAVLRVL